MPARILFQKIKFFHELKNLQYGRPNDVFNPPRKQPSVPEYFNQDFLKKNFCFILYNILIV